MDNKNIIYFSFIIILNSQFMFIGGVDSGAFSPGAAVNGSVDAVANTASNPNKRKKPDFSMEWKDLKIEIKVYGKVKEIHINIK